MRRIAVVIALALGVAPLAARADVEIAPGWQVGLRAGFGLPFGKADGAATTQNLSDSITGIVPLWAEVGYRLTSNVYVGGFANYAFGLFKNCPSGASCSTSDFRFGVDGQYHFLPGTQIDPWVGLGVGYEILSLTASQGGQTGNAGAKGFEFVNLQAGTDFLVSENYRVGPFATLTVAQYSKENATVNGATSSVDVPNKTLHEFLLFGVRATFGF